MAPWVISLCSRLSFDTLVCVYPVRCVVRRHTGVHPMDVPPRQNVSDFKPVFRAPLLRVEFLLSCMSCMFCDVDLYVEKRRKGPPNRSLEVCTLVFPLLRAKRRKQHREVESSRTVRGSV